MTPAHTNALARETSPYLLQHQHNPVDWHPWGPEAFDLARRTGRPIFLSIGYSTCYWCHVMERQVFEDDAIAARMNDLFVNVKVDREERPDVDTVYMTALQATTGHGGWPMSVFLTPPGAADADDPGLKPIFCGTYFPPEPAHGQPGFPQVLAHIHNLWTTRRDDVLQHADRIADAVRASLSRQYEPVALTPAVVQEAGNTLLQSYDPNHGGFGRAPKFPQPSNLAFLLKVMQNNPNEGLAKAIAFTLESMARGGMYDQVAGGFHRYSTDARWLVPHFEKMLYDNAQLLTVYLTAQALMPDSDDPQLYARVARETADCVLREMVDDTGALWSAQDAEVDTCEGLNYLWTPQQIREAIDDKDLADLAIELFGLDRGTNFQDPHHPEDPPQNVLYLPHRLDAFAKARSLDLSELLALRQRINASLLAARNQRKQPHTDDKVLLAWNGMMIGALARAGRQLDDPRYTDAAAAAVEAILTHMTGEANDSHTTLLRTMRRDVAKLPALLDDYAWFVHALIELHRATGNDRYLDLATTYTTTATHLFAAGQGGYYDTLADDADLFVRVRSLYDGALPTGSAQMVHNLIDLHEITGEATWLDRAVNDLRACSGALVKLGPAMVHMQHALLRALELAPDALADGPPPEVSQQGGDDDEVVTIEVQPTSIPADATQVKLAVLLRIQPGYHLTAPGAVVALIATELTLQSDTMGTLEVRYPDAEHVTYPFADEPLPIYTGSILLRCTLERDADSEIPIRLQLRYQPCTENACLEPRDQTLTIAVT